MQAQKHVNRADAVIRTHQLEFLVLRQIPQMNRAKLSECDIGPDRHRVLCIVLSRLEARTVWIRPASSRESRLGRLARGRHHEYVQASNRNLHAGSGYCVLRLGVELWI